MIAPKIANSHLHSISQMKFYLLMALKQMQQILTYTCVYLPVDKCNRSNLGSFRMAASKIHYALMGP